ncbi:SURF1 family protein [Citromicrobium sp. JLT1363]|uniref:SURF1 family protein n=1 Tax=Citromicrobium sp. JLT1363 TaxID=517722 RepID=UPI000225DFD6|nr:SURF1 family protein [Citromicrobium sp. JLT1363]
MNYLKRLPLIPTIVVLLAVATMIALGFWQLGRADEKEALLARYAAAGDNEELVAWPGDNAEALERRLYRRSSVECARVTELTAVAGTNARGSKGWARIAECELSNEDGKRGGEARIALGWTRGPEGPIWNGGEVTGIIAPGPRLVADPPRAGLLPLQRPDPSELPNNHIAYAWQWFFFAMTALVIYALAVRKRVLGQSSAARKDEES